MTRPYLSVPWAWSKRAAIRPPLPEPPAWFKDIFRNAYRSITDEFFAALETTLLYSRYTIVFIRSVEPNPTGPQARRIEIRLSNGIKSIDVYQDMTRESWIDGYQADLRDLRDKVKEAIGGQGKA